MFFFRPKVSTYIFQLDPSVFPHFSFLRLSTKFHRLFVSSNFRRLSVSPTSTTDEIFDPLLRLKKVQVILLSRYWFWKNKKLMQLQLTSVLVILFWGILEIPINQVNYVVSGKKHFKMFYSNDYLLGKVDLNLTEFFFKCLKWKCRFKNLICQYTDILSNWRAL